MNWDIEIIKTDKETCDRCGGTGKLGYLSNISWAFDEVPCPNCRGTGKKEAFR